MIKNDIRCHIGEKIRDVRIRKGCTLKSIAQTVGVSESLLSQIERNRVSPSLDTLISIAEVPEIDLSYLFRDFKRNKDLSLIQKGGGKKYVLQNAEYESCAPHTLHPDADAVEVMYIDIPPGGEKGNSDFGHQGMETGIVISGNGELSYGSRIYKLEKGSSVSFASDMPHKLRNTGEIMLETLWIISPPRVFLSKL